MPTTNPGEAYSGGVKRKNCSILFVGRQKVKPEASGHLETLRAFKSLGNNGSCPQFFIHYRLFHDIYTPFGKPH